MPIPTGNSLFFEGHVSELAAPQVHLLAIGDLNNDGLADLVLSEGGPVGTPRALRIAVATGRGTYVEQALFGADVPTPMDPRVLIGDFTGDGRADLVLYDAGTYDWSVRLTLGRTPVLFAGGADGSFHATTALAEAIAPHVVATPPTGYVGSVQLDLTMGVKDVAAADIDGDGDLDLWVESTGSRNMTSHFMINDGTGHFTIDHDHRVPRATLFGPDAGDYWRYGFGSFHDVNGDGRPDLLLQQIRDNDPSHLRQSSFVLLNDGSGYFARDGAIRLPLPDFFQGYTSAQAAASADLDGDGRLDLVLVHTRNDDVTPQYEPAWTGTYVQLLLQNADGTYTDATAQRLPDPSAWTHTSLPAFEHAVRVTLADANQDGRLDIVLGYANARPGDATPVVLQGQSDGRFTQADATFLSGGDGYFAEGVWARDLDGDGRLDFLHLDPQPGPNGTYDGGGDDYMAVVAQLARRLPPALGGAVLGGTAQADRLAGGSGNDILIGGGGDDLLDGGAGLDIAVFQGVRASYTVTRSGDAVRVAHGGTDGTDTLTGIERLHFSDATVAYDITGNAGQAYRLYRAAFDRQPDLPGLGYQIHELDRGLGLVDVAANFIASPEFQRMYGALDDVAFVNALYRNVLDRGADAEGLAFHTANLANGMARGQVLVGFSESPENQAAVIGVIEAGVVFTG